MLAGRQLSSTMSLARFGDACDSRTPLSTNVAIRARSPLARAYGQLLKIPELNDEEWKLVRAEVHSSRRIRMSALGCA